MEMEQAAKLLMQSGEKQASQPSEEQLKAITKWVGMFMELNHKEISELGMAAYIEGLKDLSVAEIERGCARALKEVDHMPTVAHIRQRVNVYEEPIAGNLVHYEPVTQEERDAAVAEVRKSGIVEKIMKSTTRPIPADAPEWVFHRKRKVDA